MSGPNAIVEDNGTTFRCKNCGHMVRLGLPCDVRLWSAIGLAFDEAHKTCAPWTPNAERHGPWAEPATAKAAAVSTDG